MTIDRETEDARHEAEVARFDKAIADMLTELPSTPDPVGVSQAVMNLITARKFVIESR